MWERTWTKAYEISHPLTAGFFFGKSPDAGRRAYDGHELECTPCETLEQGGFKTRLQYIMDTLAHMLLGGLLSAAGILWKLIPWIIQPVVVAAPNAG